MFILLSLQCDNAKNIDEVNPNFKLLLFALLAVICGGLLALDNRVLLTLKTYNWFSHIYPCVEH